MLQAIINYHQDDEQHWVAELACGHKQHVRHRPPWEDRGWVTSTGGRKSMLGYKLTCKLCEFEMGSKLK
ncbi:DUF3565 domain-containing protein [Shewanella sp. KX20019]|uniref:DUF3565 domain-containing protein n=1 Tax=Shewanella sp. KX20019 TaxID=2803864 RepID=UPI001928B48B|nr:DUF3565 domain-containing protein [Shewanella sp. KX20019]QQX79496.1 DUF3565 domain-containing protein [Shewanella sp. KX20019]